jgi:hypothetical protein
MRPADVPDTVEPLVTFEAFGGDDRVHERRWERSMPRKLV